MTIKQKHKKTNDIYFLTEETYNIRNNAITLRRAHLLS